MACGHSPQSKSAVADFDHFVEWPKPAYTRFRLGEGRTAAGSPGWGDGDAAHVEALSPPPGPLARADLPPAEPRYSEGSATPESDRSRQQPTSVGGGDRHGRFVCDAPLPQVGAEAVIPITTFAGKKVAVFGLGSSGMVAAGALAAGGADVAGWDD